MESNMNISAACIPKARELPEGFVYLDEYIEDCIIDAKYAGTDNFMGRPAEGYERALVVASSEVAEACIRAADILRKQGYVLKIFDAYRPQRAVDDFCRWAEDEEDQRRKPIQYPNIDKLRMFEEGYIAKRSSHTRGRAIDLTLVDMTTHQEVDMGTIFDYMDPASWPDSDLVTDAQRHNRYILRNAMLESGFSPYEFEWWHFNIEPEPYPDTYFDFIIR